MTQTFDLAIYIPTYNRRAKLSNCIAAIAGQIRGLEDRVIVCVSDNGSDDGTSGYLKSLEYPWLRLFQNESNQGFFLNVLRGFTLDVPAEFVWIIGDDDYVLPGSISGILSLIAAHPAADYIFCNTKAYPMEHADRVLGEYFSTGRCDGGTLKSRKYVGTAVVPFSSLIDPEIADTLLGELMVSCFRRTKVRFNYAIAEKIHSELTKVPKEAINVKIQGLLAQPHNLALMEGLSPTSQAVYCETPRTFNFWGSAGEWLGDYDYVFPIVILHLIREYRDRQFITPEKYYRLLGYYYAIMKGSLIRQAAGASKAKPFTDLMKGEMFDIMIDCLFGRSADARWVAPMARP